ncbi:MAG: UMP kinase [Nanoarchaeota archaeon]|nr:UMP kinase [Nanoarchaeota archaeon]
MKVVISLGGSVIVPKELDVKFLKEFVKLINKFKRKHKFSIVCGGGHTARIYTRKAKEFNLSTNEAHELGISATHLNAQFLAKILNAKFSKEHPLKIGKMKGLIVSGGYKPGWTTDTDAALIAKSMKANILINITDVKGIYTKDPNKYKDARLIPKMSWKEFEKMFGKKITGAGKHYVFDPLAGQICKKNKIKVIVIGKDLKTLERLLEGKKFIGTIVGD